MNFFYFSEQGLRMSLWYQMSLLRSWGNESVALETKSLSVQKWLKMAGRDGRTNNESLVFNYILLRGKYQINFRLCDMDLENMLHLKAEYDGCEDHKVHSAQLLVNESKSGE